MPKKHVKRKHNSYYLSAAKRQSLKKKKKKQKDCTRSTSNLKQPKIRASFNSQKIHQRICDESPSRDLSRFYQIEPRWTASKRCANWLKCLPKRTYWSTGTTQSTKSNSFDDLQTDDKSNNNQTNSTISPRNQPISFTAFYEARKHRSYLTKDSNTATNFQNHPVNTRRSFETHGASSQTKTSPLVSAKQRSETARECYSQNHQNSNEFYMRNFSNSKSFDSLEKLRKTRLERYKQMYKDIERKKHMGHPSANETMVPKPASSKSLMKSQHHRPAKGEFVSLFLVLYKKAVAKVLNFLSH